MTTHFFTQLENFKVDPSNGLIKQASLITLGDARGHFDKKGRQVMVDGVTLEQIFSQCKKLERVKVKADHGGGVFTVVGWADNFALTADKVLADIHIYESEPQRPRLMEIAESNPHHMGVSMEFDGSDKPSGLVSLARCSEVYAASLVDFAAANKSLFSAADKQCADEPDTTNNTTTKMEEDTKPEMTLESLAASIEAINARLSALETPPAETEDEEPPVATDPDAMPADTDPKKTLEDPAKPDDDEKTKIAEMAAERAVRKMSAALGARGLGKPGAPADTKPKAKHFEEYVADLAVSLFSGDQNTARAHILTNKQKFPDAWKAYADARNVKTL